jgi:cytochrome c553
MNLTKSLLFFSILLVILTACEKGQESAPSAKPEAAHTPAEKITLQSSCNACHGKDGVSSLPGVPFLAGQNAQYLEKAIHSYLLLDRKQEVMRQAVIDLNAEQRHQLASYYANLKTPWRGGKDSQGMGSRLPDKRAIKAGEKISRSCNSCHGTDGNSVKLGVPSLAGLKPEYFVPALKAYLDGERHGAAIMKNFKLSLTKQDIHNLAAYYSVQQRHRSTLSNNALKSTPSDELLRTCQGCHGQDGNSIHPAMPSLAGQNATYLINAMQAYRGGERKNPMMANIAKDLTDKNIEQNATYFATRTPAVIQLTKPAAKAATNTSTKFDPLGDGEKLAASCNACHGKNGNHPNQDAPRLAGLSTNYLQHAISDYRDGKRRSDMMQMLTRYLSDTDIEKISYYYANQTPEKSLQKLKGVGAKQGKKLASDCTACHGKDGNSKDVKIPSLAGQNSRYLVNAISTYKEKGSRNQKDMNNVANKLGKPAIQSLAQHFAQLSPMSEKPRQLEGPETLSKKCDRCHGKDGLQPNPEKPRIGGQRQSYLLSALHAYKNGNRSISMMHKMSEDLWEVELEAIAAYYATK